MTSKTRGVAVIVQARLQSKRLPQKIIQTLGNKTILQHVLETMLRISANVYVLACDTESEEVCRPIAENAGFLCISGHATNVLKRFADVLRNLEEMKDVPAITTVVRATADNPFLFADAAQRSVERFFELDTCDYFTFTGLPHGSGVEIFRAPCLLFAAEESMDPYEQEHVGPALYHHPKQFSCIRETAPRKWYFPELRTTVDTQDDLAHAQRIIRYLTKHKYRMPADSTQIIAACMYADQLVVFVPSVRSGGGSGHLRRTIELTQKLAQDLPSLIYLPDNTELSKSLVDEIPQLTCREFPPSCALVIIDNFQSSEGLIRYLRKKAPVVALDEGGSGRHLADYLLDIIPPLSHDTENEDTAPNLFEPAFIALPKKRKSRLPAYDKRFYPNAKKHRILVVCGGEDSERAAIPVAGHIASLGFDVTAIDPHVRFEDIASHEGEFSLSAGIPDLREQLESWDIVVTHYGFTAFEASVAGCAVVLVSPTPIHEELGTAGGFTCFATPIPSPSDFAQCFSLGIMRPKIFTPNLRQQNLASHIQVLANGKRTDCPLCGFSEAETVLMRAKDRTVSRCGACGMQYLQFIAAEKKEYTESYFFDDYKTQYGKTYLEDFESIKNQGIRRMTHIDTCYNNRFAKESSPPQKRLLDIGCAYGPFLAAAEESGWSPIGTDIADTAVKHVCNELGLPAFSTPFPALPEAVSVTVKNQETPLMLSLAPKSFAAVSMWFVIEHFPDLESVLKKTAELLPVGGVFAFSTPNTAGVTGRFFPRKFFTESPVDHFSLWDARTAGVHLARFGFKIERLVSIGHHPERFPFARHVKKGSLIYKLLHGISRLFRLGDSMEIYAVKVTEPQDNIMKGVPLSKLKESSSFVSSGASL